jgi:tRNA threonylcarbamoyladenosine biosynthesis protein TsaB
MYILHIETSTKKCSIALSDKNVMLEVMEIGEEMNHTAVLAPLIRSLLGRKNLKPGDLGAVSVSSGPGSYTGLRVGCSTAKAMSYSLGIPMVGVPTLEVLANEGFSRHPEADFMMPMIDARRKEVYTAIYDRSLKQIIPPSSLILEENDLRQVMPVQGRIVLCGDGATKAEGVIPEPGIVIDNTTVPGAGILAGLAWKMVEEGRWSDPLHFVPFYLKPPNITRPREAKKV